MNLDAEIWANPLDPDGYKEDETEKKARRVQLKLPDGRVVFECAGLNNRPCGNNVGAVVIKNGETRFRLNLKAGKMMTDKAVLRIGEDTVVGVESWLNDALDTQLGGKCTKCGQVHRFYYEEMAQSLGFASTQEALKGKLRRFKRIHEDVAEQRASVFIVTYLTHTDPEVLAYWRSFFTLEKE